ncbi:hypothetical protein ACJX0J_010366, partial [Zea mays]
KAARSGPPTPPSRGEAEGVEGRRDDVVALGRDSWSSNQQATGYRPQLAHPSRHALVRTLLAES